MSGRSITRLISRLEQQCATRFVMETLTSAVADAYACAEQEIERAGIAALERELLVSRARAPGLFLLPTGAPVDIYIGQDPVEPSTFVLRVRDFEASGTGRSPVMRERRLHQLGRYGSLMTVCSEAHAAAVATAAAEVEELLLAMQDWVENQLFMAVEDFSADIGEGVYALLEAVSGVSLSQRIIDIALIGARRGWRIPNVQYLDRTLQRFRASPGRHESEQLAATFVSTTMPRGDLLMTKALDSGSPVVFPFRQAKYYVEGSYFGIACQLRHAAEAGAAKTSQMHTVFRSDRLSVLLIYPADDGVLEEAIERSLGDLEAYVADRLAPFAKAVEFFEGAGDASAPPGAREHVGRVMRLLSEITEEPELASEETRKSSRMRFRKFR